MEVRFVTRIPQPGEGMEEVSLDVEVRFEGKLGMEGIGRGFVQETAKAFRSRPANPPVRVLEMGRELAGQFPLGEETGHPDPDGEGFRILRLEAGLGLLPEGEDPVVLRGGLVADRDNLPDVIPAGEETGKLGQGEGDMAICVGMGQTGEVADLIEGLDRVRRFL